MMKDIFLVDYSVCGIKGLDKKISLSFFKKTIGKDRDTSGYNVKGIYGINGSGKSSIILSVDILKNILINPSYLNNPIVQQQLDAIVNKRLERLTIEAEILADVEDELILLRYEVTIAKELTGKYVIQYEKLLSKKATAQSEFKNVLFTVENGEIIEWCSRVNEEFRDELSQKTTNLLSVTSLCALFAEKFLWAQYPNVKRYEDALYYSLAVLLYFGNNIHVYLDNADTHTSYFMYNYLNSESDVGEEGFINIIQNIVDKDKEKLNKITVRRNRVMKSDYLKFEQTIRRLKDFIRIFKKELVDIEIDKKEDKDKFDCSLIMVYEDYKVNAEFESTGIKKLINLYVYLCEVNNGGMVFIDELDSNLHDVYLCALLEYLMNYAQGQLCFTTHNVGPMDILKKNKKSIDFLSVDKTIYPWIKNGHYSPANLYRNGMIEGSPFNVESIDFIGVFDTEEDG